MASEMNHAISPPMDVTQYKNMAGCKISRCSIQPENRVDLALTGGNTSDLYFAVNARPNSFVNGMNTYMSFTYNLTGSTPSVGCYAGLANGAGSSFIKTLEVLAGSTSLELVNSYNVIGSIVDDFQSAEHSKTMGSILNDNDIANIKVGRPRPLDYPDNTERRICIPLLSCTIGTLAEKYLPMGKDIGLRVRMTMEDPNICLVATDAAAVSVGTLGYTLKDITLEVEYIEVPPQIYNGIAAESGNVFKICGTGISSYSTTVSAGNQAQSLLIPARYSSVRNFFTSVRRQDYSGANAKWCNSVGARTRDNITSYVYRIAGINYPQLPVNVDAFTGAEVFTELSKAWSAHASLDLNCVFNCDQFVESGSGAVIKVAPARPLSQVYGSFLMGITFEESGFSSSQMSGICTTSGNVFLDLTYSAGCQSTIFDTFCFYDNIIEINHLTGEVSVSR